MPYPILLRAALALPFILQTACCHAGVAAVATPAAADYQLLDLSVCSKPTALPPAPIPDSERAYGFERRFVDLDGSGRCVVMDFWIARLGGSDAAGMRTLQSRFLRESGRKWESFGTALTYFPHAVKARRDQRIYLVDAAVEEDVGDRMVVPETGARVFRSAGWQEEPGFAPELKLELVQEHRAEILQALAALLQQRLPAHKLQDADQARIRMLRTQAKLANP